MPRRANHGITHQDNEQADLSCCLGSKEGQESGQEEGQEGSHSHSSHHLSACQYQEQGLHLQEGCQGSLQDLQVSQDHQCPKGCGVILFAPMRDGRTLHESRGLYRCGQCLCFFDRDLHQVDVQAPVIGELEISDFTLAPEDVPRYMARGG